MRARVSVLVASLAALLLFAVPALAVPDGPPVRFYALSKIDRSVGPVTMFSAGWTGKIVLRFVADLGTAAFVFPETNRTTVAIDRVFSSFDGSSFTTLTQSPTSDLSDAHAVRGGITHLDEYQAYRKRSPDATLRITISQAILRAIDERRDAAPCPPKTVSDCPLLRGVVVFRARAYANSVGGDFFTEGGVAYLEGYRGHWTVSAATDADSRTPLWDSSSFRHSGDRARPTVELRDPVALTVPLDSVRENELFAVHVTLESMAINDRGGESTSMAFINDPEHVGPGLLKPRGLKPLGRPRLHEPKVAPLPAVHCPGGPRPSAGQLQLSRDAYAVTEADRNPMVLVTRTGGSRGATSVTVTTRGGTARSGTDFKPARTLVRFGNRDTSPRFVEIPIIEDRAAERSESFTVSLARARCSKLGKQRSASVTILDDDQPPPPPPPAFTIGGTVDGLQGSGLVLSNLGAEVPVTANGIFTLPGTVTSGQVYGVNIKLQPSNPDQICTVQNGSWPRGRRERDHHRGPLPDGRHTIGAGCHLRAQRSRDDAGPRGRGRRADPAGRPHRHRRPARGGQQFPLPVRRHPARRRREPRPDLRHRRDRDHKPRRQRGQGV